METIKEKNRVKENKMRTKTEKRQLALNVT